MSQPILVTGATGTVGQPLVTALRAAGADVRPASRRPTGPDAVTFDFRAPATWPAALEGVLTMWLLRPPDLARPSDLMPAVEYGRRHGLRHVVLLSVQGAGSVPFLPHARIEHRLRRSGLGWTFVRPSYFDQNLSTVYTPDIRDRNEIVVPSGRGRTALVDAHDVAAVAAAALLDPAGHQSLTWTPTGPALTYGQVADIISAELGRAVTYSRPGIAAYVRHARQVLGMPAGMVAVTTVLHTVARLGAAARETDDIRTVTGRPPTSFAEFAHRERGAWLPPTTEQNA